MSTKKFTKGPWSIHFTGVVHSPTGQVAVPYGLTQHNVEANARLIAAAPDLLDAMQYAINRLKTAQSYGADMQSSKALCIKDAMALLEIAMRKATQQD